MKHLITKVGIKELLEKPCKYFSSGEAFIITKYKKDVGMFIPIEDKEKLFDKLEHMFK